MPKVGQSFSLTWVWTDLGVEDDDWTWTILWGDGSSSTGTLATISEVSASHRYETPGLRTVTFRVTDKDGASGSRSIPVIVQP
jgi:hypothetical protein